MPAITTTCCTLATAVANVALQTAPATATLETQQKSPSSDYEAKLARKHQVLAIVGAGIYVGLVIFNALSARIYRDYIAIRTRDVIGRHI